MSEGKRIVEANNREVGRDVAYLPTGEGIRSLWVFGDYVPKGNLHAHGNVGEGIGRMLVSQTPGGLHERFFEEIGEEMQEGSPPTVSEDPPDMERIARIAAEYGIEMPLPGRSNDEEEGITG